MLSQVLSVISFFKLKLKNNIFV